MVLRRARDAASRAWKRLEITTRTVDDTPFVFPWKSWLAAGAFISLLYAIDLPEHARRLKRERNRARLDSLGLGDVERELGDGRYLMTDGSIRRGLPDADESTIAPR